MFSSRDRLSDALFSKFSRLIFEKTGIYLKPEKRELLISRLGKRLRATKISSCQEYYDYIVRNQQGLEFTDFIDCISTNFTSFFRENTHFDYMSSTVLPALLTNGFGGSQEILLWSAACSSGEEPYTLAMVMEEFRVHRSSLRYRIMATDISTRMLAQAKRGVYSSDRIHNVPEQTLRRFFQKGVGQSAGYVKVKKEIMSQVEFMHFNLMHDFSTIGSPNIIFCRNVMIYFNKETQQELVDKFYNTLAPGGYLFIGHSESISSLKHRFVQIEATTYRKE
ncbi:MAG: protein-glutamate O-methyltransferase CheR [Desulfobulbaceae bacterium]|nr:protein-glutamate O-methyltransferase CheR [Desulfobulbaceae bacterium]